MDDDAYFEIPECPYTLVNEIWNGYICEDEIIHAVNEMKNGYDI